MRHKLRIEALEVDTFELAGPKGGTGTVEGHMAGEEDGSSLWRCETVIGCPVSECITECFSECYSQCWSACCGGTAE
jgi:hypothetical protein